MTQHYQKNVSGVLAYCKTCEKLTMHRVDENRMGNYIEPHVTGMSKVQERRAKKKEEEDRKSLQEDLDL